MDDLNRRKKEVCDRIRRKIGGAGLTLADVDRQAGWSSGYLSQVLNGHNSFRLEHLLVLSGILGESLSELLTDPVEPARWLLEAGRQREQTRSDAPLRYEEVVELLNRKVREAVAAEIKRSGAKPPKREPE